MKKLSLLLSVILMTLATMTQAQADLGVGFMADFGGNTSGGSFYGPHVKYKLSTNNALEGALLFADGATLIQGAYQYHFPFASTKGLAAYLGGGVGAFFGDGDTVFTIPVMGGLEYSIVGAPIDLSFDWRPRMFFFPGTEYYDAQTEFKAGRFALGIRYRF